MTARSNNTQAGNRNILQNIFFGGTAGVIGQSTIFPLYTIKTRLHLYPGRYKHAFDCARSIVQQQGVRGLYRGLPPAVLGVFPEKAIKLSVNDYLTAVLSRPDGTISTPMAMLAGGSAGLCQVVMTNPMELVMINMQSAAARGSNEKSMFRLIKHLGFSGLYKGTQATLLRDIPFSMVFFSMNTQLRTNLVTEDGKLPMSRVFLAGIVSGSTAAAISTPCDVIKTRLQAESHSSSTSSSPNPASSSASTTSMKAPTPSVTPSSASANSSMNPNPVPQMPSSRTSSRLFSSAAKAAASSSSSAASQNHIHYTGIWHCARHIYATEGISGFFAGVGPRVLIISPLFGITLFFYDIQRRLQASGRI